MIDPARRYHLAAEPVELAPASYLQRPDMKPRGIWYGVGDEWREWMVSEMPKAAERDRFLHEAVVDEHRILVIRSPGELQLFARRYGVEMHGLSGLFVDWKAVAWEYAGIEIAPYLYSERFSMTAGWYYGWDVASGCVWDLSAIELHYLGELPPTPDPRVDESGP